MFRLQPTCCAGQTWHHAGKNNCLFHRVFVSQCTAFVYLTVAGTILMPGFH